MKNCPWELRSVRHGLKSEANQCPPSRGRKKQSPLSLASRRDSGLFLASEFSPWPALRAAHYPWIPLLLCAALLLGTCGLGRADAPPMSLPATSLDGKPIDLAAQPGWKVVYFWSATCPCVRACESFTFVPLARRYGARIHFYAVASDGYDLKLGPGQLAHEIAGHGLPYPVLRDGTHHVAQALNAKVTPQAFLLDPQGRVLFAGIPDDSRRYKANNGTWGVSKTYLSQAITEALAGHPVTVPRVKDEGCIIAW